MPDTPPRIEKISQLRFAAIDFESAGAERGSTDVPVQVGIARMDALTIVSEDLFTSYLSSDRPITWTAQKVHGIRTEDLAGAPALIDLWPKIKERLENRWIVAHGAATEKRFLRAFPFHGFRPWIDTLKLARTLAPHLSSHALGDIAASLGIEENLRQSHPNFRWHDALSDAIASLEILKHLIANANLGDHPPDILLDIAGQR